MKHIVTNWENDLIDAPEAKVVEFASKKYPDFELQMLSGLKHRYRDDLWKTLKTSFAIIMQPSLLDKEQVTKIVSEMAHGVWLNFNSNTNNLNVRHFDFISANPFEDLCAIRDMCSGHVIDSQGEQALPKIVKSVSVMFYGFDGEQYEMSCDRWRDIEAIRHS